MPHDLLFSENILRSDEVHFNFNQTVNKQNFRTWGKKIPRIHYEIPLYSPKVTVWCGFMTTYILGPFYFEKVTARGSIICSVSVYLYYNMLHPFAVQQLQQKRVHMSTIFMQDGVDLHFHGSTKELLLQHFTDVRVISQVFPKPWPSCSLDLNPSDFRL